jgi:hypothetical protein
MYGDCSTEELALQIFGCVGDEFTGEDVLNEAAEILKDYLAATKSK